MDDPLLHTCGLLHSLLDACSAAGGGGLLSPAAREALARLGTRLSSVAASSGQQGAGEEGPATAMTVNAAGGAAEPAGQADRDIATILPTSVLFHIVGFLLPRKVHAPNVFDFPKKK